MALSYQAEMAWRTASEPTVRNPVLFFHALFASSAGETCAAKNVTTESPDHGLFPAAVVYTRAGAMFALSARCAFGALSRKRLRFGLGFLTSRRPATHRRARATG